MSNNCPRCGEGQEGKDSYCDECYSEFLGTHAGARGHDERTHTMSDFWQGLISREEAESLLGVTPREFTKMAAEYAAGKE
jgi:hypothetical protein